MAKRTHALLVIGILAFLATSCASVPTGPLSSGEVRLVGIEIPGNESIGRKSHFDVLLRFQSDDTDPKIENACYSWSGDRARCFKVKDVRTGTEPTIRQTLLANEIGRYVLRAYVTYIRNGTNQKSNEVGAAITVVNKKKKTKK